MADDQKALTIEAGPWGPDAVLWLSQALGTSTIEDLEHQANNGAALFYIRSGAAVVGAFLLRIDLEPEGPQGVIVAGAARDEGVDILASVMPSIESRFQGVTSIRYHTNRPGLVKALAPLGYAWREIICVKDLRHGQ